MKKSILLLCFSFFFANNAILNASSLGETTKVTAELRPCTVKIKGTFDGVEVNLEVTVDATWLECTFFKRGVRKAIEEALKNS